MVIGRPAGFSLGPPQGDLEVTGDFTQTSDGSLEITLAGTTEGVDFDRLRVSGALTLAGSLKLNLDYAPEAGDSFDVLDWGSASGAFSVITTPTLDSGLEWDFTDLYSTGRISIVSLFDPADFDENENVNQDDLLKWQGGFGVNSAATHMQGDADRNGVVDGLDFLIWQVAASPGSSVAATGAAPEPGAAWLAVLAVAAIEEELRCERRRQTVSC